MNANWLDWFELDHYCVCVIGLQKSPGLKIGCSRTKKWQFSSPVKLAAILSMISLGKSHQLQLLYCLKLTLWYLFPYPYDFDSKLPGQKNHNPWAQVYYPSFINVKQTVHYLNHNYIAVLYLTKAHIPAEIYDTLYLVQELHVAVAVVKDIYAKKPKPRAATGTISFSAYHMMKIKAQTSESISPRLLSVKLIC